MGGKKRKWLERNIGAFMQRYARKSQRGIEPNDRRYDRKTETMLKRLPPEELDRILRGELDASLSEGSDSGNSDVGNAKREQHKKGGKNAS